MKKLLLTGLVALMAITGLTACDASEADVVSENLSKSAESFDVQRRIVFINTMSDKYLLSIEGRCSFEDTARKVDVTCEIGDKQYSKYSMGKAPNVTYVTEQLTAKYEDPFHYKIVFRPETIVPDVDLETSLDKK